jgi:hypothetical protein
MLFLNGPELRGLFTTMKKNYKGLAITECKAKKERKEEREGERDSKQERKRERERERDRERQRE